MSDPSQQLAELLDDPVYQRTIRLLTKEVEAKWNYSSDAARSAVLSAIGEPLALASIHEAWLGAKDGGQSGLAAVISRRRVLDLLGKDARRPHHLSIPLARDELDGDPAYAALGIVDVDPRTQLECLQLMHMIRGSLACFAAKGAIQSKQAHLLRRRVLDEASYRELALELNCKETALRVRVCIAMKALYRHIEYCHPELLAARRRRVRHV